MRFGDGAFIRCKHCSEKILGEHYATKKKRFKPPTGQMSMATFIAPKSKHADCDVEPAEIEEAADTSDSNSTVEQTPQEPSDPDSTKHVQQHTENGPEITGNEEHEVDADGTAQQSSESSKGLQEKISASLVHYPWLIYDEKVGVMKCKPCMEAGRINSFTGEENINFRTSSLNDHMKTNDHKTAVIAPKLQKNLQKNLQTAIRHSPIKKGGVAMKAAYWIAMEALPLIKFKSLMQLLHELGVPELSFLHISDNATYSSAYSALEFLQAINRTLED